MTSSRPDHDGAPSRRRARIALPTMAPAPEPGAGPAGHARSHRVFVTGGLVASAAVLAMSVQSGQVAPADDDITPCATCGDPADPLA